MEVPETKPAPRCENCRRPMPPRAWTGRPRTYCSDECREEAAAYREALRSDELAREHAAEQEARWKAREEERARREEREYQLAIAAGGVVATNARWERLYDETTDRYGGRYGLCQWEDEDEQGDYLGRECTRRTTDVYCAAHSRELDREAEERRRSKERAGDRKEPERNGSERRKGTVN